MCLSCTVMCVLCYRCFITNIHAGLGGVIGPCVICIIVAVLLISLIFRLQVVWSSYDDIYCDQTNSKGELDMLRQHKPPPIRRIRISDFGLLDPKRDTDRHQNCITWSLSHALPLQKISSKSVHKFASNPTDRQTDKQTDKQTDRQTDRQTNRPHRKHNLLLRRR